MSRNQSDGRSDRHEQQREGSIVKIRMKDFITYDSVVCHPGQSLNIVIGPNGTGKSTILMAIVLGLGGKPAHLGKGNTSIQDFIKSHRQEAQIEIELYRHGRNTTIKRTILRDGKSLWHLNGRQVPMKDIDAETKTLNIQVDNLCQVLAQDRVQDFAKLNKQELLEATQKAVGKEGMSEIHSKLKDLQKKQKQLENQLATDKKKREVEQGHVDRLKGAVEKMDQRKAVEKEAEVCRLKLNLLTYKKKFDEVNRYKEMKQAAEVEVKKINDQIQPFKQKITQAEQKLNALKNQQTGMDRKIRKQFDVVKSCRDAQERLRHDILDLESELNKHLKSSEGQKSEEDKVRQAISKLRNDIAGLESSPAEELRAKSQQLKREIGTLADRFVATERKKYQINSEIARLQSSLTGVNQDLSKLENFKELRLRQLQEINQDAYRAAMWVDKNRHMFQKSVFLPMIVELDVDPAFAKYVENAIGYNDLVAIVCESKEDVSTVVENCRNQQNLRVNVLHADSNCPQVRSRRNFQDVKTKFPEFEGYLVDFVKGPKTLTDFLCFKKNFHNIPVALSYVDASDDFGLYYAGNLRKGNSKSRYRADLIYFSDPINNSRFFQQANSKGDEEKLRLSAATIKSEIDEHKKVLDAVQLEMDNINAERVMKRNEMGKIEKSHITVKTMTFQLGQKEKELASMERNRIDPKKLQQEYSDKLKAATLKLVHAEEPFYQGLKDVDNHVVRSHVLEFEVKAARAALDSSKRFCRAEQEAMDNAKLRLDEVTNSLSEVRTDARNQLQAIKAKNKNKEPGTIWTEYADVFSTLPNGIEELETHIEEKTALAQILGGANDATIVRDYQGHLKQLEMLTGSIAANEAHAINLVQDMTDREQQWKEELNELVDSISSNFSRCFNEMKCAGQVDLFTGNNDHDYDNYGLRVRVRFRDDEDLQDLNAHTQSGGERAVSTAIYMLALQELTPAPFRLVDEINQGMDSKNERKVYELLLRSTSRPGTPQYFLLTPKLLKDMEYNPGTTVLCVMNSACAPSHKLWDIEKFISLRKQMGNNNHVLSTNHMDVDE